MQINSALTSASSLYSTDAVSSMVSTASKKAQDRLTKDADSTRVQLSAYGQVKSATAQVESAAKKLQDNKNLGSASDVSSAVQGLVSALNSQSSTVNQVSSSSKSDQSAKVGALSTDARVRSSSSELKRAVQGNDSTTSALKQIGVSYGKDGSLTVDKAALEKAYQANPSQVTKTLNDLGSQVSKTASDQLSTSGSVGSSINRLSTKLNTIEQKQTDLQARVDQSQKAVQQQQTRLQQAQDLQAFALNGTNAYNKIFSI